MGVYINNETVDVYEKVENEDYVEGSDDPEYFYNGVNLKSDGIEFYYNASDSSHNLVVTQRGELEIDGNIIGGSSYTAGDGIDITNDVISNTQKGEWAIPVSFGNSPTSVSQRWTTAQLSYIKNAVNYGYDNYPLCLVSGLDIFRVVR